MSVDTTPGGSASRTTTPDPGSTADRDPDRDPDRALLRATRPLSTAASVFLAVQLFGNLYEQVVTNVADIADPEVGGLVDELAPGSPVYYYLPWAPLGVVLVAVLAARLPRLAAPRWVVRRVRGALAALALAVAVKVVLVTTVNPRFRDPDATVGSVRGWAVTWAFGNAVAVLAVAAALVLLLSWRARLLDAAGPGGRGADTGLGGADAPRPVPRPHGTTRLPSDSVSSSAVRSTGSTGTRS